jgi:hypothetical protein
MIDNDLNGRCSEVKNRSMDENLKRIDRYLKDIPSFSFAKVCCLVENDDDFYLIFVDLENSFIYGSNN